MDKVRIDLLNSCLPLAIEFRLRWYRFLKELCVQGFNFFPCEYMVSARGDALWIVWRCLESGDVVIKMVVSPFLSSWFCVLRLQGAGGEVFYLPFYLSRDGRRGWKELERVFIEWGMCYRDEFGLRKEIITKSYRKIKIYRMFMDMCKFLLGVVAGYGMAIIVSFLVRV